uniref:Uncharacterized protein n=1 Tax=Ixodes ricinus TaxID=34613 RepID=A0A6B0UBX6_IXORI
MVHVHPPVRVIIVLILLLFLAGVLFVNVQDFGTWHKTGCLQLSVLSYLELLRLFRGLSSELPSQEVRVDGPEELNQ